MLRGVCDKTNLVLGDNKAVNHCFRVNDGKVCKHLKLMVDAGEVNKENGNGHTVCRHKGVAQAAGQIS